MSRAFYIILGLAMVSLAIYAATTTGQTGPRPETNSLSGKIVIIPPLSNDPSAQALYYQTCRIERIGSREFFVAEKISVWGKEDAKEHMATGIVDYVPWERISGFTIYPPELLAHELGKKHSSK